MIGCKLVLHGFLLSGLLEKHCSASLIRLCVRALLEFAFGLGSKSFLPSRERSATKGSYYIVHADGA